MKRLPATRTLTVALLGALLAVGSIAPAFAQQRGNDEDDKQDRRAARKEQREEQRGQRDQGLHLHVALGALQGQHALALRVAGAGE